jgi:hypothetical protein
MHGPRDCWLLRNAGADGPEHLAVTHFIEAAMNWIGEYVIDDAGECRWSEGLRIQDAEMQRAYRKSVLLEFMITTFASMGVKTGVA